MTPRTSPLLAENSGRKTLHVGLLLVVFLVMLNGFLRGALKAQIDAGLSVAWMCLLVAALVTFGWQPAVAAVALSFLYGALSRPAARATAQWFLSHPPGFREVAPVSATRSRPEDTASAGEIYWLTLPFGVGLAIGLNAGAGWRFLVVLCSAGFALAEIILRLPGYRGYRLQLGARGGRLWYLLLGTLWNGLRVAVGAALGVGIQALRG